MREDTEDFHQLFLNQVPLMDVRAPVEFAQGAFPTASNIPILDDSQRQQVGIRYKNAGEEEAIRLGLELATAEIVEQRMRSWSDFCQKNPQGYLYCFRGGLRSRTTQSWLKNAGVDYPLVKGGYKAMRRFLLEQLEESLQRVQLICVSGLTGVGKTHALRKTARFIDFEDLANHRGSAFGSDPVDFQPSVVAWENAVSIALMQHLQSNPKAPIFVEDEARRIGRICMPESLCKALAKAPRAIIELDIDARIELIREDYIVRRWPEFKRLHLDQAEEQFKKFVLDSLSRIQNRLGDERYRSVRDSFKTGLDVFFTSGQTDDFAPGIRVLLEQYYDPMYGYQIEKKQPTIVFSGKQQAFLEWVDKRIGD